MPAELFEVFEALKYVEKRVETHEPLLEGFGQLSYDDHWQNKEPEKMEELDNKTIKIHPYATLLVMETIRQIWSIDMCLQYAGHKVDLHLEQPVCFLPRSQRMLLYNPRANGFSSSVSNLVLREHVSEGSMILQLRLERVVTTWPRGSNSTASLMQT